MGPKLNLLRDGFRDGWVRVTQQKRTVAGDVINVLVAVHVPFARTFAVGHVQGKGLGVAGVVSNAAREYRGGFQVPLGGTRVLGDIVFENRCHRASLSSLGRAPEYGVL